MGLISFVIAYAVFMIMVNVVLWVGKRILESIDI